jgi:hypothetical protein
MESMDADYWLKYVEKKLQVVQCNNHEKVLLASHQLSGPAAEGFSKISKPMNELVEKDKKFEWMPKVGRAQCCPV